MTNPAILALNSHAGYACRHSGACCTAGWPTPVEPDVASRIRSDRRLAANALDVLDRTPDGAAAVILPGAGGACPFFEAGAGGLCAIQRPLGYDHLPAACRHFPRATLLEPDAARVTLSHFCPTVAWMLFRDDVGGIEVVPDVAALSRPLDIPLLHAAIRSADLLLQHLSNLDTLVRSLSAVEQETPAGFFETIGLEALDE